ncbi:MAG: hypothetical protein R3C24_13455 [Cyanobacteriota/Melainabacteria group bacterium]
MDLFFWLLALVVLSLTFAPFLASTYLLVTSAKDLVAACRLLVARSRVSSFPVVAVAVSVSAAVLGLCWNFQSLLHTAGIWLYILMSIYTFLCLPIGMLIARNNGGWLPKRYQPIRLFFVVAAIPLAIPTIGITILISAAIAALIVGLTLALIGLLVASLLPHS